MKCPKCNVVVTETKGSPVSPYLNVYECPHCGWRRLRCGESSISCDGYMEAEEIDFGIDYPEDVRYTCVKCGWTGLGARLD